MYYIMHERVYATVCVVCTWMLWKKEGAANTLLWFIQSSHGNHNYPSNQRLPIPRLLHVRGPAGLQVQSSLISALDRPVRSSAHHRGFILRMSALPLSVFKVGGWLITTGAEHARVMPGSTCEAACDATQMMDSDWPLRWRDWLRYAQWT